MATDWAGTADAYERSFGRLTRGAIPRVLDELDGAARGGTVLDAGTGTGAVAAALAARGVDVIGVDADPGMVAFAAAAHPGVRFAQGRLPDLPFAPDAFSAAVAHFVVNHLPDPRAGVRDLARVTAPGGTVVVTVWPSEQVSALDELWNEVLRSVGVDRTALVRVAPDLDFARTPGGMAGVLADAGLQDGGAATVDWTVELSAEDLWRGVEAGIATVGTVYRHQDAAGRRALRSAYERITGLGMLSLPLTAVLGVGRAV